MDDPNGLLAKQGKHSRVGRLLKVTSVAQIAQNKVAIKNYILQAIEIEKAGKKIDLPAQDTLEVCSEFQQILDEDPTLEEAFYALTPGRQRGYLIHFSGAKQSATRIRRIEKLILRILDGLGMQD